MRRAAVGLIVGITLGAAVARPAHADWVWPVKGNDTGGIIAWDYALHHDAQRIAVDHCAYYGKVVKPLAAQRYYGGYISFACIWRPAPTVVVYPGALRVKG